MSYGRAARCWGPARPLSARLSSAARPSYRCVPPPAVAASSSDVGETAMICRVMGCLACLVLAGAVSGQSDRVKEFEGQLKQPGTREAMLRFIVTDEGAKSAERILALLL